MPLLGQRQIANKNFSLIDPHFPAFSKNFITSSSFCFRYFPFFEKLNAWLLPIQIEETFPEILEVGIKVSRFIDFDLLLEDRLCFVLFVEEYFNNN
jgi:hypothetical protein